MGIGAWIVVGLIAGLAARMIMPGKESGGILATILLGIGGAFVGSLLALGLGISNGIDNLDFGTLLLAILGSLVLLLGSRAMFGAFALGSE